MNRKYLSVALSTVGILMASAGTAAADNESDINGSNFTVINDGHCLLGGVPVAGSGAGIGAAVSGALGNDSQCGEGSTQTTTGLLAF